MNSKNKFIKYLIIFLDGVLLGIVSLGIPGFSASTIAVIIGIYFVLVESMANLFSDFKRSILFLIFLYLGYGIGSACAALGVNILFEEFPLATILVVIGMIIGAFPDTFLALKGNLKKISGYIVFIIIAGAILCYNFFATEGDTVTFPDNPDVWFLIRMGFIGLVTSATFIIPGVDFAIVFLSLGLYYPFSNMLANIIRFGSETYLHDLANTGKILGVYLIGYFVGVFLLSKLVKFLTKKYKAQTLFANAAFIAIAPIIVVKNCAFDNENYFFSVPQLIIGIILGLGVGFLMFWIGHVHRKKEKARLESMLSKVDENVIELAEKKEAELDDTSKIENLEFKENILYNEENKELDSIEETAQVKEKVTD
ncbi:MAG: DUF368 domain-containing protein [Acholeplasmatales bacterium]|nr:DUF368 domain-containing protein [Acholeplasmatales bacterium]